MIHLAGLDEIPSPDGERARRRIGRVRRPEHRRGMWIGPSISIPGSPLGTVVAGPPPFDGNFASLFPGAYQVVQCDKGLQYGAVMRADAGNTSGVAFALTGATPAVPVPIWIRITGPGVGNVYYDGLGVTPAMVGVTIVDSVNIVLTGAGAGMAITPGVGSQVAGNTWRATCSGLADQSGNAKHYTQVTPAQQPIVTAGLNGKVAIAFDGIDDTLNSPALPGLPYSAWGVCLVRQQADATLRVFYGGPGGGATILYTTNGSATNPNILQYAGASANETSCPANTFLRLRADFGNATTDGIQAGANPRVTGLSSGPGTINAISLASNNATWFLRMELLAWVFCPIALSSAAADVAVNTPGGYGPGAIAV